MNIGVSQATVTTRREKTAFALANFGNIPIMTLIGSYLMIFYTDVVGLAPASVATLFLITRILDGLNDPVMGYIIDHLPRTRLGRFRSYLLIGVVVCSLNYLLLWFGPLFIPAGKLAIAYISYVLIGITFDMMDIPLNSMIPVMTSDQRDRSVLSTIKGIFYLLGGILFTVGTPLVLSSVQNPVTAYTLVIMAAFLIVLVCTIVGVMGLRERIEPINDQKYGIRDVFRIITLGPVLSTFLTLLLYGVSGAMSGSSNIYYATYILDNKVSLMSIATLLTLVGLVPALGLQAMISRRLGKKYTLAVSFVVSLCAITLRVIVPTSVPLWFTASVISGFSSGLAMTLVYGIQADNVDYTEYALGQRAEGCIASLNSFVIKAGQGIGGALSGYILAATGYVANQSQTETAKRGILLNVLYIPIGLALVAGAVFLFGYRIDKKMMDEITTDLEVRRKME